MLARLQRWVLASLAIGALTWLGVWWALGHAVIGIVGALAFGFGHAVVLAIEFMLLAALHRDDPTPRATTAELLKAWLGECALSWRVFCWQQPFRSRRWADVPGRAGERGVVFVHGYVCNRGLWNPWLARWHAQARPFLALDLEPVFCSLDTYVAQVEAAVTRLRDETGLAPVLVCHSMGGLVARAWVSSSADATARIERIVTIGTPHAGTWLARWSSTENARLMRQSSEWLGVLATRETGLPKPVARHFTCFYSHADNIVIPPAAGTLSGADNRHLRATAHVAMAYHPQVIEEVERWLRPPYEARTESARATAPARG